MIVYRFWETTRAAWRPARFDKAAATFANRRRVEPQLPWELKDRTIPPAQAGGQSDL